MGISLEDRRCYIPLDISSVAQGIKLAKMVIGNSAFHGTINSDLQPRLYLGAYEGRANNGWRGQPLFAAGYRETSDKSCRNAMARSLHRALTSE
jgi:hypothetical protein